jgi:hypothetical protein
LHSAETQHSRPETFATRSLGFARIDARDISLSRKWPRSTQPTRLPFPLPLVGRAGVGGIPEGCSLSPETKFDFYGVPPSLTLPHVDAEHRFAMGGGGDSSGAST